jgi:hypothetical protein
VKREIVLCSLILLMSGCQRDTEKLVEVSGHIFVFNYRVATATALVTLQKTGPLPEGATAVAAFEDPAGGPAIIVEEKIFPAWEKVALQSPNLRCVRKDRPYAVTVRLRDASGRELQVLTTQLISDVDQSVLPEKPLVVGPGYDRNPEVFKADGSTDFASQEECHKS